jgi:GrpB-like predicted nucleotidyltransferase (UPF0157 family)
MTRQVLVVPYDEQWPQMYKREIERIYPVLRDEIVSTHHIGSTSIPGMRAKPIIDILLEVKDIIRIDGYNDAMIGLGYSPRGEMGIPGRRYFSREEPVDVRTHHVHAYQKGDRSIERHLAFRDYMIEHPQDAERYIQLKKELAEKFPMDIDSYIAGKEAFVDEMETRAIAWMRNRRR